jgi:hypothetical protein
MSKDSQLKNIRKKQPSQEQDLGKQGPKWKLLC